jgi:hypothetical protein
VSPDLPPSAAALPVPPQPPQPDRPPRPSLVTATPAPAEPATPQAPAPEPESGSGEGRPRHGWFKGHESETGTPAPGTVAASAAKTPADVKKEITSLTSDAVRVLSRGVHFLLAAGDPPQRAAKVWIADAEQVEKIATPAAKLLTGAVPEALLEKTVIYAVQLAIALGHYAAEHLALREEVRTKPGKEKATLDHTGALST